MGDEKVVAKPPSVLVSLARAFDEHESKVAAAEESLRVAKRNRDMAEKKFVDQMVTEDIRAIRTAIGGFRTQAVCYPNVKDREIFEAYVKRKKLKWLYTRAIHGSKLRAYVTELMQNGKSIPPGIETFTTTVIRRFK